MTRTSCHVCANPIHSLNSFKDNNTKRLHLFWHDNDATILPNSKAQGARSTEASYLSLHASSQILPQVAYCDILSVAPKLDGTKNKFLNTSTWTLKLGVRRIYKALFIIEISGSGRFLVFLVRNQTGTNLYHLGHGRKLVPTWFVTCQ